jgi:hypothetical protein
MWALGMKQNWGSDNAIFSALLDCFDTTAILEDWDWWMF